MGPMFGIPAPVETCERCKERVFDTPERHRYFCKTKRERLDERVSAARDTMREDYWTDVRGVVSDVKGELAAKLKAGEEAESLQDWLDTYIHETIDGHERVIYTHQAQETLLVSENDGAYFDDMGSAEGAFDRDGVKWSLLAFSAFKADVLEMLDAHKIQPSDPDTYENALKADDDE